MKRGLAAATAVFMLIVMLAGCGKGTPLPVAAPVVPVSTGKAIVKDVPVQITAVGTVEAAQSVTIISRVNGQITQVHFREGQDVRQGDLLFTLDPASLEKELSQAEAKLRKEQEQVRRDAREAERYAKLVAQGAVSSSEYEKYATAVAAQQAVVADAQAAVDNAKVKLEYCYIRSPIDGRVGARLVQRGDVVAENSTKTLIINQLQPVYVKFAVPEKYLVQIRQRQATEPMTVTAGVSGQTNSAEGKLEFIDNAVDTATGTIKLKAAFVNGDALLWPGQFTTVNLTLSVLQNAIVVPSQTLQTGQDGTYIFVVKPDQVVEVRKVAIGWATERETVISQGVAAGETVVTDGQLNLKNGAKVQVKEAK